MEDCRERRYSAFLNMYPVICSWNMRLASASPVAMAVVSKACLGRDPKSPRTVVRTASCTCSGTYNAVERWKRREKTKFKDFTGN